MPTISVVVPVYNIEEEIPKCLLSILLQKFTDFEIIAVDDGSTDKSGSILNEFAKKYKQIRVFHTKNKGLSAARNLGISKARGKYIAFVDGDDFLDPDFLAKLYQSVVDNDSEIAISGYTNFYNEETSDFVPKKLVISGEEAVIRLLTRQENIEILAWNKLYLKSLFREIKYPAGKICEDNFTTYKLLARAKKVSYVPEPLYNYVRREKSISFKMSNLTRDKIREEVADEAIKIFKKNSKLKKAAVEAKLLAYFKFIDHSLSRKIGKKYFAIYREKILKNKTEFLANEFCDKKRKNYIRLIGPFKGTFYRIFRKLKHD